MTGFLRFVSVVGLLILAGMGALVALTGIAIAGLAATGINPF